MVLLFLNDLIHLKLIDVIDILFVAILLYQFYNLIKGTGAINIFLGIIAFYIVYKLVKALHMELLSEILGAFISVGFLALIVVFQPEIRKFFFLLGTPNFMGNKPKRFFFWRLRLKDPNQLDVYPIVSACGRMSKTKTGALLVIAQRNELQAFIMTGEPIDANISSQLIENIFFKNSPLHDGALIIRENRLKAARCILPVSDNQDLPDGLGLRHRAAIGITEQTDALSIVVSEQTGDISVSKAGQLRKAISLEELQALLEEDYTAMGKRP
jgi:uncharacterized protein (TIGR00159 family)